MSETNPPRGKVTKVPTREERERWKYRLTSLGNPLEVKDSRRTLAALEHVEAERDAAVKFKTFVHAYLDQHGVPAGDPENQHQKEGCRIGARLDLMFAERDELVIDKTNLASANELLREENARLKVELEQELKRRPVRESLIRKGIDPDQRIMNDPTYG